MRTINIEISKARLENFMVQFDSEGKMDLGATLGLYTEQGKKVSTYTMNTQNYYQNKFELPLSVIDPVHKIALEIEKIATQMCRDEHLTLPDLKTE